MDNLKPTRRNSGWVFNSYIGHACIFCAIAHITKQPNLKLKTGPKQLLGSLLLTFTLPSLTQSGFSITTGDDRYWASTFVSLPWERESEKQTDRQTDRQKDRQGDPYRRGRLCTIDLLVPTSLDQLLLIQKNHLLFLQNKLPWWGSQLYWAFPFC